MADLIKYLHWLTIFAFIAIKVGGTILATWSWWWILLAEVPVMWLFLGKAGLLV